MNGVFYVGATGLGSQQRALEVVANNVANINTVGFKRSDVRFSELIGGWSSDPTLSAGAVGGQPALNGVSLSASPRDFGQGELRTTGQPMDLAIQGEGFIELVGPNGEPVLWRGGSMSLDRDRMLAGPGGLPLKAMIAVPLEATDVAVARNGRVTATIDGEPKEIGRIELAMVKDMAGLTMAGEGLYRPALPADVVGATAGEDGAGSLMQGALEGANVELSNEMVSLLLLQRSYAANAQIVQAGDQLMAIANGLKR
jgi:flagellar basal-body rod protein FlgG